LLFTRARPTPPLPPLSLHDALPISLLHQQVLHRVPGAQRDPPRLAVRGETSGEGLDEARSRPPGEVEAGHGVAVPLGAAVAPLGPADDGEDPVPHRPQPAALLPRRELQVGLRPAARPVIIGAVGLLEGGGAQPVLSGELEGVTDPESALLGAVHEEQPAEAPPRLRAEVLLPLALQQQHAPSAVGDLGRGDQAREPGSDDDDLCLRHHSTLIRRTRSRWSRLLTPDMVRLFWRLLLPTRRSSVRRLPTATSVFFSNSCRLSRLR